MANNKKVKYPEFCMGYIDETLYVGSDGHKYYPCSLSSPSAHTPWPNKNASILFGIIFQKLINKNKKLFLNGLE